MSETLITGIVCAILGAFCGLAMGPVEAWWSRRRQRNNEVTERRQHPIDRLGYPVHVGAEAKMLHRDGRVAVVREIRATPMAGGPTGCYPVGIGGEWQSSTDLEIERELAK